MGSMLVCFVRLEAWCRGEGKSFSFNGHTGICCHLLVAALAVYELGHSFSKKYMYVCIYMYMCVCVCVCVCI